MTLITINSNTVQIGEAQRGVTFDASSSNYILVHSKILTSKQYLQLQALGVVVQRRVFETKDEETYLCRYELDDFSDITALPFVKHAVVYLCDFVVHPGVWDAISHRNGTVGHEGSTLSVRLDDNDDYFVRVGIYLHHGGPELGEDVWDMIHNDVDTLATLIDLGPSSVRAYVRRRAVKAVALIDCVRVIEPDEPGAFHSAVAVHRIATNSGKPIPFTGKGEVIAVVDTGFALGKAAGHPAFGNRVIGLANANMPNASKPEDFADKANHGTTVAACALGKMGTKEIVNDVPLPSDQARCLEISGTAPQAKLFAIKAVSKEGLPDANLDTLFDITYLDESAAAKKPRIYNLSWTSAYAASKEFPDSVIVSYGEKADAVDRAVNTDMERVLVWAVGNFGFRWCRQLGLDPDDKSKSFLVPRETSQEACSKNSIVVGATINQRWFRKLKGPPSQPSVQENICVDGITNAEAKMANIEDYSTLSPPRVSTMSNRGPTPELRIKPDVVAPGYGILSVDRDTTLAPRGFGGGFPRFGFSGGTSLASPMVAGLAADIRLALAAVGAKKPAEVKIKNPSAALIKAMLVNGTVDLEGSVYEWPTGLNDKTQQPTTWGTQRMPKAPNVAQGYGLVHLGRSLTCLGPFGGVWEDALDNTKQRAVQMVELPATSTSVSLNVTLAYTDPEGSTLQNYMELALVKTPKTGEIILQHPDPVQLLEVEAEAAKSVPNLGQADASSNLQKITAILKPSEYQTIEVVVSVMNDRPIIEYKDKVGKTLRINQPFSVVWAFMVSTK